MLIYNDTVMLEFSEKGHKYLVSKLVKDELWTTPAPVTGVTTITSIISKPALMTYPMNKALAYLQEAGNLKPETLREARQAHIAHSNAGKAAGKVGHAMVEALMAGRKVVMPTDPTLKAQAESVRNAFNAWMKDYNPEVLENEQPFYSLMYDYAGTYDLLAEIDGKLTIADFKTTDPSYYNPDGIYAENFAQLGGYCIGYEEMTGKEIEQLVIVNLPKNGNEFKVKTLTDLGLTPLDAKAYFLNCLGLYKMNQQFKGSLNG